MISNLTNRNELILWGNKEVREVKSEQEGGGTKEGGGTLSR